MINSAEEFVRLRTSQDMEEYHRAAWEEAPVSVWLEVIENYPDMREWVAHNKSIPHEIIEILSNDEDDKVRYVIASKRKIKTHIFEKLSRDQNESVRMSIACNPKVPKQILKSLLDDPWDEIAKRAKSRLDK